MSHSFHFLIFLAMYKGQLAIRSLIIQVITSIFFLGWGGGAKFETDKVGPVVGHVCFKIFGYCLVYFIAVFL